ncbi:mitochondrial ribosomal protein S25 [Astrocystis sublimbata]|nr:mitochondrial ribosomal protein S25 [Astrocystis sublimbata]
MGGQRQVRPTRVYETVTNLLNKRIFPQFPVQKPVWYDVMQSIPPSEIVVRPLPPQHKQPNPKAKRPSRMFQPQQLVYEEDGLRHTFYKDHPWELARPRMIIEMDGKDAQRYDWSKGLQQPGMPLCGESVVQRQLWVMHNVEGMTQQKAYDMVRREFYALRHMEDVERRIAKEEAMKVGAYFGMGSNQVSMHLENQEYEFWKKWAGRQIIDIQAEKDAAYTNFGDTEEADADSLAEELTDDIPYVPDASESDNN